MLAAAFHNVNCVYKIGQCYASPAGFWNSTRFVLYNTALKGALAEGLMARGRYDEADAIVSSALTHCHRSGEAWCLPELMRVRALCLAVRKRKDEAAGIMHDGVQIARSQGALAWELRLISALVDIDKSGGAKDSLRDVLNRITERLQHAGLSGPPLREDA